MASLTLENVTKVYRAKGQDLPAVKQLNMKIRDEEIIGLLGSSGCGKTSTLRMIAGFEDITEGTIRIGERAVNELRPATRNVAMAFEGYALYPPLKISDNIAFSLLRGRVPKADADKKVRMIAELLEIEDILERFPPNISGGQQQRVSLARALVRDADVHLLDEPMSQLEPQLRAVLRARIKDYIIQNHLTSVFVTHDQTEAVALADRIAVMSEGVLQQYGTPAELKETPRNVFIASFIGEPPMNLFDAEVVVEGASRRVQVLDHGGTATFAFSLPDEQEAPHTREALYNGRRIVLGIRPHRTSVGGTGSDDGAVAMTKGRVVSNQWLGDQTHLGVNIGGSFLIAVADRNVQAEEDSEIAIGLPVDALHFFDANTELAFLHGMRLAGV